MEDKIRVAKMGKGWVLGCIVALVLLGSTELPLFVSHPGWKLFIEECSFALVISCVFGLTIERVQRREFVRLVTEEREILKRDVFLYAYGHNIPDDVKEEIREQILNQSFYRRDLTIEWEFSSIPDKPDFLQVKKEYSYELVNNSSENKDWEFRFSQIWADDEKDVAECKFSVIKIQRGNEITVLQSRQMEKCQPPTQPHCRQFATMIKTKAQEHIRIYYQLMQLRRLYGEDGYNPSLPVSGRTTVRLRLPSTPAFQVTVSCKTQALKEGADSAPPTRYSYYLAEGLLPYQGITISWSRSQEDEEGGAESAPPQNVG